MTTEKRDYKYGRPTARDTEYVELYLKYGSTTEAEKHTDVTRETIARAVRRAGIPLTGRKRNGKNRGNWKRQKASDAQLKNAAKTMTVCEIAHQYGMSPERVDRRLRRMGICITFGLKGGHYRQRAEFYGVPYDHSITLDVVIKKDKGICQLCGKPVDLNDRVGGKIGKNYPTIDHIIPFSKGGGHTWGNVQLAHMACNAAKYDKLEP